ncbi:MAG: hypothetical protein GX644_00045 [Limnobacter sp.]|nr:hypothetical protein [Limnobacter sp.]
MKNARAARAIRKARPIARAVLTTTAIAWSLGIQLPQPAPRPTVLAQSIGISAANPSAATQASSRLRPVSRPSEESGSPRA